MAEYLRSVFSPCPVSILYKSIAGRYRPVRVADGPITARYRFKKNASWAYVTWVCHLMFLTGIYLKVFNVESVTNWNQVQWSCHDRRTAYRYLSIHRAPSEESDDHLLRAFVVRLKKHLVLGYPYCNQRRLWSGRADDRSVYLGGVCVWGGGGGGGGGITLEPCLRVRKPMSDGAGMRLMNALKQKSVFPQYTETGLVIFIVFWIQD